MNGGEASTSPFVVTYRVITIGMLEEALKLGLNPNTLISGIDFNYPVIKRILKKYDTLFNGATTHHNLLAWAAMGNIEGTSPENAVDILLKAGADPHTLPKPWNETKQQWLKNGRKRSMIMICLSLEKDRRCLN